MPQNILASIRHTKRKKCIFRAGLVLVVFVFACFTFLIAIFSIDRLKIKTITVRGNESIAGGQIIDQAKKVINGKSLWLIPRDRIFYLPIMEITANLFEKFPRLENIEIDRDFYGGLLVNVEERKPSALLCETNERNCFYLDKDGFIFENAPYFSAGVFLTFIDNRSVKPRMPDFLMDKLLFLKIVNFKKQLDGISQVETVVVKDGEVNEFYFEDGWCLIVDIGDDLEEVYSNFNLFWQEFLEKNNAEDINYVDLRFGNKIYYKEK